MSDPLLPVQPVPDAGADSGRAERDDVERDADPDVLPGAPASSAEEALDAADDDADEHAEAVDAAEPAGFRVPEPGDRLDADGLRQDLAGE